MKKVKMKVNLMMLEKRLWLIDGNAREGNVGICRNQKGVGTMSTGTPLRHHEKTSCPSFFLFLFLLNVFVGNAVDKSNVVKENVNF